MVRDNVTGLIWEAKQNKNSVQNFANPHDADNTYTWCDTNTDTNGGDPGTCGTNDTMDFLAALNGGAGFAGHTDWRIPTINELKTLIDRSRNSPASNATYFSDTAYPYYWSSTTNAASPAYAWYTGFTDGLSQGADINGKSAIFLVRAVRGGQVPTANRFAPASDTVLDTWTCLEWQRTPADSDSDGVADAMNWQNALAYAEGLALDGHTDWRLPNYNELSSLMDHSRYGPAIDSTIFPNTEILSPEITHYWSSTTELQGQTAWIVNFTAGGDGYMFKTFEGFYVLSVRNAEQCLPPVTWQVIAAAGANGSLDASTPSPQAVNNGATTQFTYNANTGYHVAGVSGCGVNYTNTSNAVASYTATTGAITSDCTVSA
ncbi:MAG: Lcl C-terminal domain-containing protein, partial [Desulfobulbaceae bacterium]